MIKILSCMAAAGLLVASSSGVLAKGPGGGAASAVSEADRHQVVFSHSLNARGRLIASGETEVVSPAKHKRDNAEAIFLLIF